MDTEYEKNLKFMRKSVTMDDYPKIKGIDFNEKIDLKSFIDSFSTTGFQATHLGLGISITNLMIDNKAKIFLAFSGNMISSGLRDIITYLVKHKFVDVIITTSSGIEEDIIKSIKPFVIGDFEAPGSTLFDMGVGRIGNIFVPMDRYLELERFLTPIYDEFYNLQLKQKRPCSPSQIAKMLGEKINNESSYLYWAAKNDISVYCPGIVDGAFGDISYFYKYRNPDFAIDVIADHEKIIKHALNCEKTGLIVLGGGISKHYALNANIFREGFDYAVYITTAHEFDGSDSGGNQEEAKTWAKIKINAPNVKIRCEATIAFPILVAGSFYRKMRKD